LARGASIDQLITECAALDAFRRKSDNLYQRVRALFFLYAIHRFHLPNKPNMKPGGRVPFEGYNNLLTRRFEEAIRNFSGEFSTKTARATRLAARSPTPTTIWAFQTLANQVRRSVRSVRGNQWMFRIGHPADQPLRICPELLRRGTRRLIPDSCGEDAGTDGPDAQRVERYFFSSGWISRKGRGC